MIEQLYKYGSLGFGLYSQFKTCNTSTTLLLQVTSIKGFPHFVAASSPLPVESFTKLTVHSFFCFLQADNNYAL